MANREVDERAAMLANAFLSTMTQTAQLARCRTDLKKIYDESIDAWHPGDGEEEPDFRVILYAMAHGTPEDMPDTNLRVHVAHGWELTWKQIRPQRRAPGAERNNSG